VLQALYNLSDDQAEFQIGDRLSFMRFLDMGLSDKAPDAKTIWLFRELLTQAGAIAKLFAVFGRAAEGERLPCHVGPDHRREPGGGAAAAQHRGGEGGDQGRRDSRGLAGAAGQAAAEGS